MSFQRCQIRHSRWAVSVYGVSRVIWQGAMQNYLSQFRGLEMNADKVASHQTALANELCICLFVVENNVFLVLSCGCRLFIPKTLVWAGMPYVVWFSLPQKLSLCSWHILVGKWICLKWNMQALNSAEECIRFGHCGIIHSIQDFRRSLPNMTIYK